ncbi:class I SAM-dependent methyltransferase [Achromobacter seleniivolatilans]|uniref:class I SAM-dependent methyltransferase n=1 Tax=Achromobacter seleniivolatilans TaxID=3047478 RepID=UPI0035282DBE
MTAANAVRSLNRSAYEAIAVDWDNSRGGLTKDEARLFDLALRPVAIHSRVLDLGCGTGRPVADLVIQRKLHLIGVDNSPAMLALARRRLPGCEWVLAPIEEFVLTSEVAAVVVWDSIFHIPREHHAQIFQKVRTWLATGASFLLTVGGTAGGPFTASMHNELFFFDSLPLHRTHADILDAGFKIEASEYLDMPSEHGDRGRVAILARAV